MVVSGEENWISGWSRAEGRRVCVCVCAGFLILLWILFHVNLLSVGKKEKNSLAKANETFSNFVAVLNLLDYI